MNEPIPIFTGHASPRLHVERDAGDRVQRVSLGDVEITGLCKSVTSTDTASGVEHVIVLRTFTPTLRRVAEVQGGTA